MSGNDWNGLGRDVKDIVENAINTGDFGALNRDLGVTLENAIGNMARNFRKPGANDYQTCDQNDGRHKSSYRPYGNDRSYGNTSRRIQKAREEFALFINTRKMKGLSIAALITGLILAVSSGFVLGIMGIVALLWEYAVDVYKRQLDEFKELLEELRKAGMERPISVAKEDWSLGAHQLQYIYETEDGTSPGTQAVIELSLIHIFNGFYGKK